ncbi:hypothetical protein NDA15_003898 [Ustilago hordei]|nr:hypothetical protein NDA15_003898 [Ustilago hordei]
MPPSLPPCPLATITTISIPPPKLHRTRRTQHPSLSLPPWQTVKRSTTTIHPTSIHPKSHVVNKAKMHNKLFVSWLPSQCAASSVASTSTKAKKFNARKELVLGEDYYGIKIFRFYIKCTQCSAEITFKTDPKNADYVAEHGASRNFIPTKDDGGGEEKGESGRLLTEEEKLESKLEKMQADPMKQLEERTMDSRREMEILDALQDIRTRNARLERVDAEAVLASLHGGGGGGGLRKAERGAGGGEEGNLEEKERRKAEEEDEELVNKYFGKALDSNGGDSRLKVKRKLENETEAEPDVHTLLAMKGAAVATAPTPSSKKKKNGRNALGLVRKKK